MVERHLAKVNVEGSNPFSRSTSPCYMNHRTLRRPFEYLVARMALFVIPRLSRTSVLKLARGLGTLGYWVMRRERKVGMANLTMALPDASLTEHRRILRTSVQTFALSMLDTFWLARDTKRRLEGLVLFDPDFRSHILIPGAQVCITGHLGNWEVMGLAVSHQGFPLASVAAPLKNPWVDTLFNGLRQMAGQHTIPKKGALRHLITALKEGGKIALVMDQNVKPANGGIFVDFFGRKAPFSAAAAQLALRTHAPVLVGACIPNAQGVYPLPAVLTVNLQDLPTDEKEAVHLITQRIACGLEALIRAYPECWLWTYKRWKIRPDHEDPARYPFYTRPLRPADQRA